MSQLLRQKTVSRVDCEAVAESIGRRMILFGSADAFNTMRPWEQWLRDLVWTLHGEAGELTSLTSGKGDHA